MSNKKPTNAEFEGLTAEEAALFAKIKALPAEKKAKFRAERIDQLKRSIAFDTEEFAQLAGGAVATDLLRKIIAEIQVPVPGVPTAGRGGVR